MKYLTMKNNETLEEFKRRVKFEIRGEGYYIQSISEPMGKGIQVVTLIDEGMNLQIKLEVDMYNIDEIAKDYNYLSAKPKAKKPLKKIPVGLGNIEDIL